jgi:hypothetical protein
MISTIKQVKNAGFFHIGCLNGFDWMKATHTTRYWNKVSM